MSACSSNPGHSFSRRDLLRVGCVGLGGLGLSQVLRLRSLAAAQDLPRRNTAVIFVTLGGGASQFETYDPKPNAPAEYRGAFQAIATNVAGIEICETLPRQAQIMDKLAVVRSVTHRQASHIAHHIIETGFDLLNSANARRGEMPSVGSVVSRVRGPGASGIPAFVSLPRQNAYSNPHWLGAEHQFFAVNDDPNQPTFQVSNLALSERLTADRLRGRLALIEQLEGDKELADLDGESQSIDAFSRQAFELITSDRARLAFQIDREDPRTRDRYGRTIIGQRMLLARRLVEAEVPFVSVRMADWDDHIGLADKLPQRALEYDTAIAALVEDLHERGMQRDVLVVAIGEFGRTPKVNLQAGRDHYPGANSALIAGGDYRMGQVIGQTDRNGIKVVAAPYAPQSVLTMAYRHLGIDPGLTFPDYAGRPRYVLDEREPIVELL